jgi:hypothetical protein
MAEKSIDGIIHQKKKRIKEEKAMKQSFFLALPLMIGMMIFPMMAEAQMMGGGRMGGGMMGGWGGYGGGYGGQYPPYGGGQYQGQGPGGGYGPGPGGGYGTGPGYGPGYGMGPGMMGPGRGYGMGPGMMGPGYGNPYGPQYGPQNGPGPQYGGSRSEQQKPLNKAEARREVENYLQSTNNPNLKLGEIKDKGSHFEADIVTKKGHSLADKIYVDKDTGAMRSAY